MTEWYLGACGIEQTDEVRCFVAFPYDSVNCVRFKGYTLSPYGTPPKPF